MYVIDNEWDEPPNGPLSCDLSPASIVWGQNDAELSYADGLVARDKYRARFGCGGQAPTVNVNPDPCVEYQGCSSPLTWCSLPNHGHELWSHAGEAFWSLFAKLR